MDGAPVSASLFDFGLAAFHLARRQLERGSGPYFYLPEAREPPRGAAVDDVFRARGGELGLPRGTIRATVLIETSLAAFEMDEILYELREHSAGLNAGRWDYIFSVIKTFRERPEFVLPDRGAVTMTVPFMRAYAELLVATCHRRGAHAIGGMAAFVPNRRDPDANAIALAKVREDKEREAADGFDGTWVAHPDLVPTRPRSSTRCSASRANQVERLREDVSASARSLLAVRGDAGLGHSTEGCARTSRSAIRYLDAWLAGSGAVAIGRADGGRGDGRDLALAGLAVGAPRPRDARGRARRGRAYAARP